MSGYLAALAVTLLVEPPVLALAVRLLGGRARRGYLAGLGVNLSSHPLAWFVWFPLVDRVAAAAVAFVVAEALVVAWETYWLGRLLGHDRWALLAAVLAANGLSLAGGALL